MTAGIDWQRLGVNVSGPLLTLALAILFDVLTRHGVHIAEPMPLLLAAVAFAGLRGGFRPGLVSAVLAGLYALHYFSATGRILSYTPENLLGLALSLLGTALVLALATWLAPRVWSRTEAVTRPTGPRVEALERVERALDARGDLDRVLQDLAQALVPAVGDWSAVHLVDESGNVTHVASAHREPGRDVLLQALRRYVPREATAKGDKAAEPVVWRDVDAGVLRSLAQDEEHLKRLQTLGACSYLIAPIVARGRALGAISLATIDPERRLGGDDVAVARLAAARVGAAMDDFRLEREATDAERRYRLLFEDNPQPMWVFSVETLAFLAVNDAAVKHYGYSRDELLGMTIMDFRPPEELAARLPATERMLATRDQVAITQHQKKDGTIIDVELRSHEVPFGDGRARLVLVTDVTDRARTKAALQQSEEQLRKAQRLDAVGRLAAGIAHDFNNLLTAIQGYSELLLRDMSSEDGRRREVDQIRRAADRGALLTRQLLTFGQQQAPRPKSVDVNALVGGMETLLQRLVGADVQLATVLAPGLGRVQVDPGQIEQVLMNLVLNARDAMPRGGTLTIETGERHISGSARSRHIKPGRYVVVSVTDSGMGMDEETQAHLFERFFTTKSSSSSPGLGLSIVYSIVRQNGGVIRVSSEPGHGTTVKIYLPMVEEPADTDGAAGTASTRGLETILLVEDEEPVRELLRKVLMRQGYTVIEARHGKDALLAVERHRGPLQLVVTDVVMPEMGGRELVEHLESLRPDLRVLYISGYTNDDVVRRGVEETEAAFIQKPFSSEEFVHRVRELLDAPSTPRPVPTA